MVAMLELGLRPATSKMCMSHPKDLTSLGKRLIFEEAPLSEAGKQPGQNRAAAMKFGKNTNASGHARCPLLDLAM
jgi:hypothetical protein